MKKHSYIAAFDLDKTLLAVNSSRLMVMSSKEAGFMSKKEFRQAIYYSILYKFDLKNATRIVAEMIAWLNGLAEAEMRELLEEHILPELKTQIRPEIRRELEEHRSKNARLVLLSSAMTYLCESIASYLNMDDVVCSRLESKDGILTGKALGNLVFEREKAVRMKSYCEANGYSLEDAWYYGDAFTDRFILDIVGNPVAVKPEIKLKLHARRNGWKIIN